MTEQLLTTSVIVVGRHVVLLDVRVIDPPHAIEVRMTLDSGPTATYKEPGWQQLSFGFANDTFYWWSARRVVALPLNGSEPELIPCDDDLRFVFAVQQGWLLVSETSVRLVSDSREVWRSNLADVAVEAHWEESTLVVRDFRGTFTRYVMDKSASRVSRDDA